MIAGILTSIAIYFVVVLVTLGLGVGVGYLVNWIVPSIGLSSAVIIGMIANVIALISVVRFLAFYFLDVSIDTALDNDNDDDDDDDDDQLLRLQSIVYVMNPSTGGSPRRRRRNQK